MMTNSSQVSYFTFVAYIDTRHFKYFCFMTILLLYALTVGSNVLLIAVICVNRSLHEPMYMFLCSLFVNELYGSTGLFPFLLLQILSDVHTVPAAACFLQIFCVYSYGSVEYLTLAVMSYDRYLAICCPLQYNRQMTCKNIVKLTASVWLLSFVAYTCTVSMVVRLQLCGNIINKVYCDYHSIVKLSCSGTTVNNIYGLLIGALTVFGPLVFILYTYMKILYTCGSLLCPILLKMIPEEIALEFTRQEAENVLKAKDLMEFLKLDVESRERTANLTQKGEKHQPEERNAGLQDEKTIQGSYGFSCSLPHLDPK